MRGDSVGDTVGLPDIHLVTAGAGATSASVSVVGGSAPALNVGLAVDELDVARALRVAVASAVLGTSLVRREARQAAVLVHLRQVERAVETARQVRHVHVERELLILKMKHLVLRLAARRHEVHARADVLAIRVVGDEFQGDGVAARADPVRAAVVCAIDSAVRRTGLCIGAEGGVPGVSIVAVLLNEN